MNIFLAANNFAVNCYSDEYDMSRLAAFTSYICERNFPGDSETTAHQEEHLTGSKKKPGGTSSCRALVKFVRN